MLLDNLTSQIVHRVISRYLTKADPPLTEDLEWPKVIGSEDACFVLAELNREFGARLFPKRMSIVDADQIDTVKKLVSYIEAKAPRALSPPRRDSRGQ